MPDREMTFDEHRQRHIELHRALDELIADFICHGRAGENLPSETTLDKLMRWSHQQTIRPADPRVHW
jgi:hypothetical protein